MACKVGYRSTWAIGMRARPDRGARRRVPNRKGVEDCQVGRTAVMGSKTVDNADPEADVAVEPTAPRSLESWLKRELQALYDESEQEPLPPGVAELVSRLEEKLRGAKRAPGNKEETTGEGSDRDPTRGPEKTKKGKKP